MSAKNSQQLKQLQTRKAKLETAIQSLEQESKEAQKAFAAARNQLQKIKDDIDSLKEKELVVTEHAILRYLERAMGLDIERIKGEILNDKVKLQIAMLNNGNGKYPIEGGLKIIVKDNTIVSVV